MSKFTPKIIPTPGKNNKETIKHVLANIEKVPLPPLPILLWDAKILTIFIFLFFYFSDFILIFFFFSFSFGR